MKTISDADDAALENCVDNDVPEGGNWWSAAHRDVFYRVGCEMLRAGMPLRKVCTHLKHLYQAVAGEFESED